MHLKFSLTVLLCLCPWFSESVKIQREHSLQPPYTEHAENLIFWDLTGSAQLGGNYIRLTTDETEKKGAMWNNFPLLANNWEFQLHFHIHGKGVHLNGDGMALWYTRDSLQQGPVFGSKDYFHGLGVFIDTFQNQRDPENVKKRRHPYISAMVNNGTVHYESGEDGTMTQVGGCHVPIRNLEVPTKIAVSYIDQVLAVYLDIEGLNQWRMCFRSEGVHLPTGYYFGVSASTSDITDNHDIVAVTTLNLDSNEGWIDRTDVIPHAENVQIPEKYVKDESSEEKDQDDKDADADEDSSQELLKEQFRLIRERQQAAKQREEERPKERTEEEPDTTSTSWVRKLIYISGGIVVVLVLVSMYRGYAERRRERMQKRLF